MPRLFPYRKLRDVTVVTRREFLGVAATTLALASTEAEAQGSTYVYASESHFAPTRERGWLAIGFLITSAAPSHIKEIASLKKRTRYRRAIRSGSNDTFRVGCEREMVRYFAEARDLRFAGRVIGVSNQDLQADSFRVGQFVDLFASLKVSPGATLRMKRRQRQWRISRTLRGAGEREHEARVKALLDKNLIQRGEAINREKHDGLIEMSSLLTGLLFGAVHQRRDGSPSGRSDFTGVVPRLTSGLGVTSLLTPKPGKWDVRQL